MPAGTRGAHVATEGYKLNALRILSEVTTSLASDSDIEELLGRFLGMMIRLSGASAGAVRLVTSDGAHLRMVASIGLPPEVVASEKLVPINCGVCGVAVRDDLVCSSVSLEACAQLTGLEMFARKCATMVVVPLRHQRRVLGTFNLFLCEQYKVPEDVSLLFRSIGEHLGMALENARLKRENLRIALMNERQLMANEVHDSLAQTLAYMKMRLALLQDALGEQDTLRASKYTTDVGQALDSAYVGLRQLLTQFRNRMDPLGLLHALQTFSSDFERRTGIALEYESRVADLNLSVDQEVQVFYIVQEALANVVRHSGARHARLVLEAREGECEITVEDDGRGFFAIGNRLGGFEEHPGLSDHFGLSIMRERAQRLGGRVETANLPAGGARVRLLFPMPENIAANGL